jgi:glycosyltransferase involved in cell wall biosynthesis
MKVLITVAWARRFGGGETMLTGFLRAVDRRRVDVQVVFFEDGPLVAEVAALGMRTLVIPAGRLRRVGTTLRAIRSLAQLLLRERPDVLLNWTPKTQIYGAAAALLVRRADRVAWWQHTIAPRGRLLDRLAGLLPARAIVCSSRCSAAVQSKRWPSRRVLVVHPGIEVPPLAIEPERCELRARLGIPTTRAIVGLVGRLEPGKQHEQFLDLIAGLRRRGLDIQGLIVGGLSPGSGPHLFAELRAGIMRRSLEDAVTLAGQVPDAGPYIELMDVLVSVTSVESFGIALLEAMARGVPVVARAAGGPEEIIEPGRSGLLVRSPRPADLVSAVELVLSRPSLRQTLRAGGSERVRTHFTSERMTRDIERALAEVCAP